jgi:hypothetical protein
MLFSKSPRSRLLDRIGAGSITERPVSIDLEDIEAEKEALIDFLRKIDIG